MLAHRLPWLIWLCGGGCDLKLGSCKEGQVTRMRGSLAGLTSDENLNFFWTRSITI